jgi:hypothetical protein
MGRPRKYQTQADRQRAYLERKQIRQELLDDLPRLAKDISNHCTEQQRTEFVNLLVPDPERSFGETAGDEPGAQMPAEYAAGQAAQAQGPHEHTKGQAARAARQREHRQMDQEYRALQERYARLAQEHAEIQTAYTQLEHEHAQVQAAYAALQQEAKAYNAWRDRFQGAYHRLGKESQEYLRAIAEEHGIKVGWFLTKGSLILRILECLLPEPSVGNGDDLCTRVTLHDGELEMLVAGKWKRPLPAEG